MNNESVNEKMANGNILDLIRAETGNEYRKKTEKEYAGPCPLCGGKDRFLIWPDENRFFCRQCGKSGDDVQFLMYFKGMNFPEAAAAVGRVLNQGRSEKQKETWIPITPVPDNAQEPEFRHYQFGKPSAKWAYRTQEGKLTGYTVRFDPPGQRKEIWPLTYCRDNSGSYQWKWKGFPSPTALYGLDLLAKSKPGTEIILAEGEKAADAGNRIAGDSYLCMTWSGGTAQIEKADFSPLQGRTVIIWPDNDKPGTDAAMKAVRLLKEAGAIVKGVIRPDAAWPEKADLADFPEWDKEKLISVIKKQTAAPEIFLEQAEIEILPDPVMFDGTQAPDIDPACIPDLLKDYCLAVAESFQVPFELPLIGTLGAVSIACQKKFKIQVKPDVIVPINFYGLYSASSGERKSSVFTICKEALDEWETEQIRSLGPEKEKADERIKAHKKRIDKLQEKAAKVDILEEERAASLNDLETLYSEMPEPVIIPRLMVNDITAESLADLMCEQNERIGVMDTEGGIFDTLAGRYNGGVSNISLVTKSFDGEKEIIDRKGRSVRLENPIMTFCVAVQPDVIRGLEEKDGFRGRGFLGRFLYFCPKSRVGNRIFDPEPMPDDLRTRYNRLIRNLIDIPWNQNTYGENSPYMLTLDRGAYNLLKKFHESIEPELKEKGELEYLADFGNRLIAQAVRLAGLFHLVLYPSPQNHSVIEADTMQKAITLAATLAEHTKAVHETIGSDANTDFAKKILEWIMKNNIHTFTRTECWQRFKKRKNKAGKTIKAKENLTPALDILIEREIIAESDDENGDMRTGKKATVYRVNKKIFLK